MSRKLIIFLTSLMILGTLIASGGQARSRRNSPAVPTETVLTNKDIMGMAKAGLPADVIIAKIQASACRFDTSPSALEGLKSAGVPDSVILALVKHSSSGTLESEPSAVAPPSSPKMNRSTGSAPAAPSNPKVYIEPANGFEKALAAGLVKKQVPVEVVSKKADAEYILTATVMRHTTSTGGKIARGLFAYGIGMNGSETVSAELVNRDQSVVWAYTVKKGSSRADQSCAEAVAKHLKSFMRKHTL